MRLRDDDMDRYRPPVCLREETQNTHLKVSTHTTRGNLHREINTRETTTRLKDGVTFSLVKMIVGLGSASLPVIHPGRLQAQVRFITIRTQTGSRVYLPDSDSRGSSVRESALKSKGSASCSSSMQSLSGRLPEREYFASVGRNKTTVEFYSLLQTTCQRSERRRWWTHVCCCWAPPCPSSWSPSFHGCSCSSPCSRPSGSHNAPSTPATHRS